MTICVYVASWLPTRIKKVGAGREPSQLCDADEKKKDSTTSTFGVPTQRDVYTKECESESLRIKKHNIILYIMTIDAAAVTKNDEGPSGREIIEEVWDFHHTNTGNNNDDDFASSMAAAGGGGSFSLQSKHQVHTVDFGGRGGSSTVLRYMGIPDREMTPLDMTYVSQSLKNAAISGAARTGAGSSSSCSSAGDDDDNDGDTFYDGTGNLMWTAALCFGYLVAQTVEGLRRYLYRHPSVVVAVAPPITPSLSEEASATTTLQEPAPHRVCELGCGTGGAGIALLLFSSASSSVDEDATGSNRRTHHSASHPGTCHPCGHHHVVFTDSDAESLDLCKRNCELNQIHPDHYSQHLLVWGQHPPDESDDELLRKHSFDTVLATDVVYDLKMIPPMLGTVDYLLKKDGGHLILSHVPRFCLPKEEDGGDDDVRTNTQEDGDAAKSTEGKQPGHLEISEAEAADAMMMTTTPRAYLDLERHIQEEAKKVGLCLVETIRPHLVLNKLPQSPRDGGGATTASCCKGQQPLHPPSRTQQLTLDDMKESYAVVFIFGREGSRSVEPSSPRRP